MKLIFFGTPDFAVYSLKKIYESEHEVLAIVTAPDKQRGRGRKVSFTPVKEFALQNNIPVLQPEKLKDEEFIRTLSEFNADIFVIVAFRILPEKVFTIPPKGTFNLHGSILPKYRGAAPIQWSLINGDTETGVTTFFLQQKVDTGNIILQEKVKIDSDDDFGQLHDKLAEVGSELVIKTMNLIESENIILTKQDDSLATRAPKITRETMKIDWQKPSKDILNLVRGLSPYPGTFFEYNGKTYKVWKAQNTEQKLKIFEIKETKKQLFIGTNDNAIEILEIQPEGKRRMTTEEFLRGYSLIKENK